MKTIRVIIAFLSIYLFVSALLFIIFFGVWLARYYPDSSMQEVARVTATAPSNGRSVSLFDVSQQVKGTNCLLNTVTRASNAQSELAPLVSAETTSIFILYKRFLLNEKLVPLGYMSMVQLSAITDSEGKTLYSRPVGIIDSFFEALLGRYITRRDSTITLVAQETTKTYTVTISTEGVISNEN